MAESDSHLAITTTENVYMIYVSLLILGWGVVINYSSIIKK